MILTCKQCGKEFELSDEEIKFYESKKLNIPKRCSDCRKLNKLKAKKNAEIKKNKNSKIENKEKIDTAIEGNDNDKEVYKFDLSTKGISSEDKKFLSNKKNNIIYAFIFFILSAIVALLGYSYNINAENTDSYEFRNDDYLLEHFEKHNDDFDYENPEQYVKGANKVITSTEALHKTEKSDGDDIYYIKATNEFVIVSDDGYIRTYFKPKNGIEYYNNK